MVDLFNIFCTLFTAFSVRNNDIRSEVKPHSETHSLILLDDSDHDSSLRLDSASITYNHTSLVYTLPPTLVNSEPVVHRQSTPSHSTTPLVKTPQLNTAKSEINNLLLQAGLIILLLLAISVAILGLVRVTQYVLNNRNQAMEKSKERENQESSTDAETPELSVDEDIPRSRISRMRMRERMSHLGWL